MPRPTHRFEPVEIQPPPILFVYEGNHRPLALFDTFAADKRAVYVDDDQCGPYLLDPSYLACTREQAPGRWRLRQFAPDHFYLGEYYLTYDQQTERAEEVAFFVDLGGGAMAVLSLMRSTASCAFGRDKMQLIECAQAVVEQVTFLLKQSSLCPPLLEMKTTLGLQPSALSVDLPSRKRPWSSAAIAPLEQHRERWSPYAS
jgi:hypothetical protein